MKILEFSAEDGTIGLNLIFTASIPPAEVSRERVAVTSSSDESYGMDLRLVSARQVRPGSELG